MTDWFVTRHKGAAEWAAAQGIHARLVPHLDPADLDPGDRVFGTLPVFLAAELCARGARYFHLTLDVPQALRGKELSAADMHSLGAKIEEFEVRKV